MSDENGQTKREMRALLDQAKTWQASVTGTAVMGANPFNTEASRMLLAAHIQLLETLVDGKPSTKLPSRHHV